MKQALKFRNRIPYGGNYSWTDPATKVTVSGINWDMLIRNAREQRRANNVPTGLEFEDEIERDLCVGYPKECQPENPKLRKRNLGMMDIVRGTLVFASHKLSGSELVTQEEASRRASLCANCPQAMYFTKPCSGLCGELVGLLGSTSGKSTPYDNDLRGCSICRCWSKVAVWFPLSTQCVGVDEQMKQAFDEVRNQGYPCWKQC